MLSVYSNSKHCMIYGALFVHDYLCCGGLYLTSKVLLQNQKDSSLSLQGLLHVKEKSSFDSEECS